MGFGKDGRGVILYGGCQINIGGLASLDVIGASMLTFTEDFRLLKLEGWGATDSYTVGASHALLVGLADGDLSDAEIEECLEARSQHPNDRISVEQSERPVWPLGILTERQISASEMAALLNNGQSAVWKQRWTFGPSGIKIWAYNFDNTGAFGTAAYLNFYCKLYGVWVK